MSHLFLINEKLITSDFATGLKGVFLFFSSTPDCPKMDDYNILIFRLSSTERSFVKVTGHSMPRITCFSCQLIDSVVSST